MQNKKTKHSSKQIQKKKSRNRSISSSSPKIQKYQNINLQFQQIQQNEQKVQDLIEEEILNIKVDQNQQKQVGIDLDAKISEFVEKIHLNIISRSDIVQLEQNTKLMPIVLQIQVLKQQIKHAKANIDLICVVDVSGSMMGKSIELVKESLRYVQKILNEGDRISIISFSSSANVELSWTNNSLQNKDKIKKAIQGMKIRDSTNIASGVNLGFQLIKQRKQKNPVTCMIVLSDGQDDQKGASYRIAQYLKEYDIEDNFVIYTFGYGSNHDPIEMNNISNLKNGQFTFIENIKKVSEHFILSMGGLLSVFAKNTILSIEENPQFKIQKLFGDDDLWQQKQQGVYEMNINYLLESESKEFALMIEIPSKQDFNQQGMKILKATLKGNLIEFNSDFEKQQSLSLQFTTEQIQEEQKEIVEVNYLRSKSGDIIKQAQELAQQEKYEQAKQLLDEMIEEIQKSKFNEVKTMINVLTDLNQIKEVCQPTVFKQKGQAVMINKRKKHSKKQKALSNSSEWNSEEEEQLYKFKRGDLMLSCSDQDDNSSFSNSRRRRSSSSNSSSDYEDSGSDDEKRKKNRKSRQKYSSSSRSSSPHPIKKRQRRRSSSSDS